MYAKMRLLGRIFRVVHFIRPVVGLSRVHGRKMRSFYAHAMVASGFMRNKANTLMKELILTFAVIALTIAQAFACAAITKKGTQCKRAPSPGSQYCWQHGGTTAAQRAAGLTDADVAKLRCKAITRAGTQCKRTAQTGSDYCWQHAQATTATPAKATSTEQSVSADTAPISTERQQCEAITKKGSRCSRKALPGGTKCWQHAN